MSKEDNRRLSVRELCTSMTGALEFSCPQALAFKVSKFFPKSIIKFNKHYGLISFIHVDDWLPPEPSALYAGANVQNLDDFWYLNEFVAYFDDKSFWIAKNYTCKPNMYTIIPKSLKPLYIMSV